MKNKGLYLFLYFLGVFLMFVGSIPEDSEARATAPFAADTWALTLGQAVLWPLFVLKYIILGLWWFVTVALYGGMETLLS